MILRNKNIWKEKKEMEKYDQEIRELEEQLAELRKEKRRR